MSFNAPHIPQPYAITTDGNENVAPGAVQVQPEPLATIRDLLSLPSVSVYPPSIALLLP